MNNSENLELKVGELVEISTLKKLSIKGNNGFLKNKVLFMASMRRFLRLKF